MSGEKKHWRLSIPFRRFYAKQDIPPSVTASRSRSRVSSVYLSDDSSSTSDFIIVPEFDCPVQPHATYQDSLWCKLPSPSSVDAHLGPTGSHRSSFDQDSHDTSIARTDDLTQRLDWAYEHIRSMSIHCATFPGVFLSSDPQMLRKQLGVPQHSVFNYPTHSSLDLPNPYISTPEPMSSKSPPIILPDVVCTRTFSEHGLRRDRGMNPQSPTQPSHSTSVVNTPALIENPSSQCGTLEAPWSAQITCTSKPRSSAPNPSRSAGFRAEKTTSLPSSPSSSRRRALKGVLRKPYDTLPSANTHKRQISLPQIRPSSPFEIGIPLHHPWHNRRTDFNASVEYPSKTVQSLGTSSSRTSGSTEFLASLAWIGIPHVTNRKCHLTNPSAFSDRFSMGIAVEDDSISDDDLVDRLERARKINDHSDQSRSILFSRSSSSTHFSSRRGCENMLSPMTSPPSSPSTSDWLANARDVSLAPLTSKGAVSDAEDAAVWQAARKALLCTREIVRTEKKYQEALKMLLNAQTATPPPPSMAPYVSGLVRVSEMLLKRFLEDPSAWGVSTAFVASEDELEATMVSWCAVAGSFFTDENDPQLNGSTGRWRIRKPRGMSSSSTLSASKRTSVSLSPQLPPVFPMVSTASKKNGWVDESQHPQTEVERRAGTVSPPKLESANGRALVGQTPSRKLSVRDLAIQPIQRVMRYVLLYKDLLDCTPATSPPRLLVERALEAAARIASHCDRAQRNPAFCHTS